MNSPRAATAYTSTRDHAYGEQAPYVALPTLMLLACGWGLWIASSWLALSGVWPWSVAVVMNTVAAFSLYAVAHEACHGAVAQIGWVNAWIGRLALPAVEPWTGFRAYRFMHTQHHRFTNREDGSDPDSFSHDAPRWQLPARWLAIDLHHVVWYARRLPARPWRERLEVALTLIVLAAAVWLAVSAGLAVALLVLWLLPARLALLAAGVVFCYLPHAGHGPDAHVSHAVVARDRTAGRRLLAPLTLNQTYHRVHHLHPSVPFYRYARVWRHLERVAAEAQAAQCLEAVPAAAHGAATEKT